MSLVGAVLHRIVRVIGCIFDDRLRLICRLADDRLGLVNGFVDDLPEVRRFALARRKRCEAR